MKYGFPGPVNDVLYRKAYVASYNRAKRNPNWVAEHLRASSFSTPPSSSPNSLPSPTGLVLESEETSLDTPDRHKASFREDLDIPRMFRAKLKDYSGSGFDRGHLVPAADVKESQEAMSETFLLTNISPQVGPGFNRAYWFHFENFTRSLTTKFDDVYVVTGPLYLPKKEEDGKYYVRYQVIGEPANTAVPTHFYKVILGVKDGKPALGAFVLPNEAIEDRKLEEFVLPLDAVEHASGLVFFPEVNRLSYKPLCQVTKCEVIPFRKAVRSMNGAKAWGIV
ncbi:nuclease [Rhizophlyctis rosea]|uniref:Endonuclease n=1 Tax=Rhizophlyctis rosea TaxID=64517 RepID=A0AAD5S5Z1_9FUNG|nr:nuclease [Rhizophlyctis rosea]